MRVLMIVIAGFVAPPTALAQTKRPNVLVICGDDHAAYALGSYGNKIVRTPSLDKLAAQGMRFTRAYCTAPVCTPSRQSFLTGRYPRTIGVTQLRTALPEAEDTLAELLKRAGYITAAIGKMHFNSNLRHGFDVRLDTPDHNKWLAKRGKTALPAGVDVQPAWRPFKDHARTWLNSPALPVGLVDDDMAGTWFARQALGYLRAQAMRGKEEQLRAPFFLMVSFTEPHSPFHFPVEYRGRYAPEKFAVPKVHAGDEDQVPAIFRDLTDREKQGITAAYYTSVEFLDRNIGLVLAELDRLGLAEDTLVIYLGDHGYCLGHHGRFEKHSLWEEAVRSPLIVRWPGRVPLTLPSPQRGEGNSGSPQRGEGGASDALVSLHDIVPTILEAAGEAIPKTIQGKSIVPLLGGGKATRTEVFVEYAENEEAMIRTDRWAFMYGSGKRERQDGYTTGKPLPGRTLRLFDMHSDPGQITNLAQRPEHARLVADLRARLLTHLRETAREPEVIPQTEDVDALLDFLVQPRDLPSPKK